MQYTDMKKVKNIRELRLLQAGEKNACDLRVPWKNNLIVDNGLPKKPSQLTCNELALNITDVYKVDSVLSLQARLTSIISGSQHTLPLNRLRVLQISDM